MGSQNARACFIRFHERRGEQGARCIGELAAPYECSFECGLPGLLVMFKPSVVLSAIVALACSSCSFIFVHPPHRANDQLTAAPRHCTSSRAAPIIDAAIATLEVVRTSVAVSNDESAYQGAPISRNTDIGFGVGFATLFLASSIYGFVETGECHPPTERIAPPDDTDAAPAAPPPADPHSGGNRPPPAVKSSRPASPEEP